jgi:hypothetical protein
MGPICASLLLIGGGITYWLTNNTTVVKEKNIVQIEPVVTEYKPIEPEPEPDPMAMRDPASVPLPPLEPEPEVAKPLPHEVTLKVEILSIAPEEIKKRPDLLLKSSIEIYAELEILKTTNQVKIIHDKDYTIVCKRNTVLGKADNKSLTPDQEEFLYMNEFRAGVNGELIHSGKHARIVGLSVEANYSPITEDEGIIAIAFRNIAKEVDRRIIPNGGKDGWFPQFDSLNVKRSNLKLTELSPVLVWSFLSSHKILDSSSGEPRFYFVFVTLK